MAADYFGYYSNQFLQQLLRHIAANESRLQRPASPDTSHARARDPAPDRVATGQSRRRPGIPSLPSTRCQLLLHSLGKTTD
jgi:hypothetical protein